VSSGKRRRQSEARRRVELAQAEQRRAIRTRRIVLIGGAVVSVAVLVSLVLLVVVHHGSSEESSTTTTVRATTAADFGQGPCPRVDGSSPRTTHFSSAPRQCIDPTQTFVAKFQTSAGNFTVTLDAARAPVTVNNFIALALYHYYDGTTFHRAIPGYIVQGGDPNGKPPGTGSPGYTIVDELPTSVSDYKVGSIAMANTGQPHTGGGEFFFWLGPNPLPAPAYSLFGKVVAGLDVVRKIEATGTPAGDVAHPVTIQSVIIGSARIASR
jgi:cyclophilin family peptidyl-prolyl cis-trans isomerase